MKKPFRLGKFSLSVIASLWKTRDSRLLGPGRHRTLEGNHKVDGGIRAVQTLLASPPLPTVVLCSNDLTAIGGLRALQQAGLHVPRDVSVVGFDDVDLASFAVPPLTTIRLSRDRLGWLAFQALQTILKSRRAMGADYIVETELVVRQSTAAPGNESGTLSPQAPAQSRSEVVAKS